MTCDAVSEAAQLSQRAECIAVTAAGRRRGRVRGPRTRQPRFSVLRLAGGEEVEEVARRASGGDGGRGAECAAATGSPCGARSGRLSS